MQISPITLKPNTSLKKTISSKQIIELYKNDLDVDVCSLFNNVDTVDIYECLDSGFFFYAPNGISGDENLYNDLKQQMPIKYGVPYYSNNKWEYDICINYIRKSDKVYEIGAGSGAFLEKLKNAGVFNLNGSELNKASIELASKKNLILEYKTIEQKAQESSSEFDIVCTFQVLEHVENVHSFLISALNILKSGGKLIIAVPYNNPYLFNHDIFNTLNLPPHHMGLWNKITFQNLPNFFPLVLEEIIIEKLPNGGYDFERFFEVNKDLIYKPNFPFKKIFDKVYYRFLKKFHYKFKGKNIIAIFQRN